MSTQPTQRHKRVRARLPMTWRAAFSSTVYNISRGGLYFRSRIAPAVGERLELEFSLSPNDVPLRLTGVVRWVSDNAFSNDTDTLAGVGLQFENLPANAAELIEQFVARQESPGGKERSERRLPVRIVVEYMFAGETYRTLANDISRKGLFLVSTEPLQLEDMLHMRFRLPDIDALIKARGTVRWRHDAIPETLSGIVTPGMGVEFTDISEDDRLLIEQFLSLHPQGTV